MTKLEEDGQTTTVIGNGKPSPVACEECKLNPSKYKCPGCSVRSCSLACVKAHKLRSACTGKRPLTTFVPLSQFDDNQLISDYNFLEELKRVADSAHRKRVKLCGYPRFKLPHHLHILKNAARYRGTKLLFLPCGMSRREKNQSRYDQREKLISWTIELRFHSTGVVLLDHGINESRTLRSVIENHLKPCTWNDKLTQFYKEELDCLKFYIRKYPKGPASPFYELDISTPISQQFSRIVLLEYPVIYICLPSDSFEFGGIKNSNHNPCRLDLASDVNNHESNQEGAAFKEEEINDNGCSSDPRVLDLMNCEESRSEFQPPQQCSYGSSTTKISPCKRVVANDTTTHCVGDSMAHKDFEMSNHPLDMEFDFEQGLIDAYSDLITEINPDDFLDLDADLVSEDQIDFGALFPVEEELEEGEIPEF